MATTRLPETDEQQPRMSAGRKPPYVGKVQILGDEKTIVRPGCLPDIGVRPSAQTFVGHRVDDVTEAQ